MEGARSISIREAVDALPGPRQPKDLAVVNDSIVRVAQLEGEFPWHEHEEDEVFLCWDGSFRIAGDASVRELTSSVPLPCPRART